MAYFAINKIEKLSENKKSIVGITILSNTKNTKKLPKTLKQLWLN